MHIHTIVLLATLSLFMAGSTSAHRDFDEVMRSPTGFNHPPPFGAMDAALRQINVGTAPNKRLIHGATAASDKKESLSRIGWKKKVHFPHGAIAASGKGKPSHRTSEKRKDNDFSINLKGGVKVSRSSLEGRLILFIPENKGGPSLEYAFSSDHLPVHLPFTTTTWKTLKALIENRKDFEFGKEYEGRYNTRITIWKEGTVRHIFLPKVTSELDEACPLSEEDHEECVERHSSTCYYSVKLSGVPKNRKVKQSPRGLSSTTVLPQGRGMVQFDEEGYITLSITTPMTYVKLDPQGNFVKGRKFATVE